MTRIDDEVHRTRISRIGCFIIAGICLESRGEDERDDNVVERRPTCETPGDDGGDGWTWSFSRKAIASSTFSTRRRAYGGRKGRVGDATGRSLLLSIALVKSPCRWGQPACLLLNWRQQHFACWRYAEEQIVYEVMSSKLKVPNRKSSFLMNKRECSANARTQKVKMIHSSISIGQRRQWWSMRLERCHQSSPAKPAVQPSWTSVR